MLNKWTCEALEWKASLAAENADGDDDAEAWEGIATDCEAALTDNSLAEHGLAAAELDNYLSGDCRPAERKAINTDLARGGHLERFDSTAVCTQRERTITVDGVKYIV